jgi:hypothetical protein
MSSLGVTKTAMKEEPSRNLKKQLNDEAGHPIGTASKTRIPTQLPAENPPPHH